MNLSLSELGVFLSSLLLSLSGCYAVVASYYVKSRCTSIECCRCIKCTRANLHVDDVTDLTEPTVERATQTDTPADERV
jgi:hypothetical protein